MSHLPRVLATVLASMFGCLVGDPLAPADLTPSALPTTCTDVADGEHTLFVDGDEARPWTAYCHGGATYLTLTAGPGKNVSEYVAGGRVVTTYTKVRIDPYTLLIDIRDQTFATSTGALFHADGDDAVTSMPFGVAMACGDGTARANIDLGGTPFAPQELWPTSGSGAAGGGTFSRDGQALDLWAEGACGWTAPELAPGNPFNDAGGYALLVAYRR